MKRRSFLKKSSGLLGLSLADGFPSISAAGRKLPAAERIRIAVIGVNAARDTTPGRAAQLAVLNAGIEAACREAQPPAFFVNTARPPLRTTEGRLNPAISRDRWHLNANGYALLSAWLREAAPNLDL